MVRRASVELSVFGGASQSIVRSWTDAPMAYIVTTTPVDSEIWSRAFLALNNRNRAALHRADIKSCMFEWKRRPEPIFRRSNPPQHWAQRNQARSLLPPSH